MARFGHRTKKPDLLEELASLNGTPNSRTQSHSKVQQAVAKSQNGSIIEENEESGQDDVWNSLKDLVGFSWVVRCCIEHALDVVIYISMSQPLEE